MNSNAVYTIKNLNVIIGDTISFEINLRQDGEPINITGYKFYLTCKTNKTDADNLALFQVTQTSHLDAANGMSLIEVSASVTANISEGEKYYDVQMKDADGRVKTLIIGRITFARDITRSTA